MKTMLKMAVLVICGAFCCSCSWFAKGAVEPQRAQTPSVALRKESLTVLVKADPELNRFKKNAHALFLCVYQLKDPNAFNQLAEEKNGVPKLLECARFDSSVANAKQYVVQPGQQLSDQRDRAEGVRYIGLATGYYGIGKEKVTELSPLGQERGSEPPGAVLSVELGPNEISSVKVQ